MLFTTDQQTLDDLNIFGKHGSDSIYSLFNRTHTRGGATLLEDWFRYPLADEQLINNRSAIIRYFSGANLSFPFRPELFDQAENYLDNQDERSRLDPTMQTLKHRLAGAIAEDSEYKTIQRGVTALLEIFQQLGALMQGIDPLAGKAYANERETILNLLASPALLPISKEPLSRKLPFEKIAIFDTILRFRNRVLVRKLLRHTYLLDTYISLSRLARDRRFTFAEALPKNANRTIMEGIYHPMIKNAVPNTIDISDNSNLIFLTGANMAGKSTLMKSMGIALFLAHIGLPVPAEQMSFAVRDGIYTTINLPDNLGMGASHFYAEVLRVKKIAKELSLGKRLFVIFDELFRGTNVKDAYEATVALTTAFAGRRDTMFIISTHIIEAGDVLQSKCANINFLYLPTRMEGGKPVYTYEVQQGISADRHGMVIINNEGILDILKDGLSKPKKFN